MKGTMVPMGDAKGAALALMVEVLAAALVGSHLAIETTSFLDAQGPPPETGQSLIVIDPDSLGHGGFGAAMSRMAAAIESQDGARLPGTRRLQLRRVAAEKGVDIPGAIGTPVYATADGIVSRSERAGGYGNLIVVRHHEKFLTYYAHLNAFAPKLAASSKVTRGETIGLVGMTGLATGPHLHFEFHVKGASGEWAAVRAPDVIDTTLIAAPGFGRLVQRYRDSLAVAGQGNVLYLE